MQMHTVSGFLIELTLQLFQSDSYTNSSLINQVIVNATLIVDQSDTEKVYH